MVSPQHVRRNASKNIWSLIKQGKTCPSLKLISPTTKPTTIHSYNYFFNLSLTSSNASLLHLLKPTTTPTPSKTQPQQSLPCLRSQNSPSPFKKGPCRAR